jgi:hypothetical protein
MHAQSAQTVTYEEAQQRVAQDERLLEAVRKVGELDFSMLKMKLLTEYSWAPEAVEEAEDLYRKFLALNLRFPEQKLCPNGPTDEFWHAHILDTRKYAEDCNRLFGGMLHHYPYFGLRGPEDRANLEKAFEETVDMFIRHFGVDPTAGDCQARSCRPQRCP